MMELVPALAPRSHLFFDSRRQRWVLTAPHKLVLLDPLSLDILLACDGEHPIGSIADGLDAELHQLSQPKQRITAEIILRFLQGGFLQAA